MNKLFRLALLLVAIIPHSFAAEGTEHGNGTIKGRLEGFTDYTKESQALQEAIKSASALVESLGLTREAFPELVFLKEEIVSSRYIRMTEKREASGNRFPGDYSYGGDLIASTDAIRGAPTRIFPDGIELLSPSQLVQLVIHEALHRALPEPMNTYESSVERITNFITQYSNAAVPLRSYLDGMKTKRLPWFVNYTEAGADPYDARHMRINSAEVSNILADQGIAYGVSYETRIRVIITCDAASNVRLATVVDTYAGVSFSRAYVSERTCVIDPPSAKESIAYADFVASSIKKIEDLLRW